jgi:hypothetical protein
MAQQSLSQRFAVATLINNTDINRGPVGNVATTYRERDAAELHGTGPIAIGTYACAAATDLSAPQIGAVDRTENAPNTCLTMDMVQTFLVNSGATLDREDFDFLTDIVTSAENDSLRDRVDSTSLPAVVPWNTDEAMLTELDVALNGIVGLVERNGAADDTMMPQDALHFSAEVLHRIQQIFLLNFQNRLDILMERDDWRSAESGRRILGLRHIPTWQDFGASSTLPGNRILVGLCATAREFLLYRQNSHQVGLEFYFVLAREIRNAYARRYVPARPQSQPRPVSGIRQSPSTARTTINGVTVRRLVSGTDATHRYRRNQSTVPTTITLHPRGDRRGTFTVQSRSTLMAAPYYTRRAYFTADEPRTVYNITEGTGSKPRTTSVIFVGMTFLTVEDRDLFCRLLDIPEQHS